MIKKGAIKLIFKTFQLIFDDHIPEQAEIKKIAENGAIQKDHGNQIYLIESEFIDNRFLWIYCQYDNAKLYGEIVLNTEKEKKHKNTRNKNEIELRKQLFVIYDVSHHLLYLNDMSKRNFLKDYFSSIVKFGVTIKNIYASLEEFQDSIKTLKQLKFTQIYNVNNVAVKDSIFNQQVNVLGLDIPNKISMQVEFPNSPVGFLKQGFQNLKQKKDDNFFKDIVLIGEDDHGIEQSFDFSSIIKNIILNPIKNDDERYDDSEVKRLFFNKIRSEDV